MAMNPPPGVLVSLHGPRPSSVDDVVGRLNYPTCFDWIACKHSVIHSCLHQLVLALCLIILRNSLCEL